MSGADTTAREAILGRLRAAAPEEPVGLPVPPPDATVFADYPDGELLTCFRQRLERLSGEVYTVDSKAEAAAKIAELLGDARAAAHSGERLAGIIVESADLADRVSLDIEQVEADVEAGISEAVCLVARTGSALIDARVCGGRRLSVLPPFHIVVAHASQLVASLEDAVAILDSSAAEPSYTVWVSGPSRTADIEKTLVLGAHGPKRLAVVVMVDRCN